MVGRQIRGFSGHVAELVYAYVSEAYPVRVGSSSLPMPTEFVNRYVNIFHPSFINGVLPLCHC